MFIDNDFSIFIFGLIGIGASLICGITILWYVVKYIPIKRESRGIGSIEVGEKQTKKGNSIKAVILIGVSFFITLQSCVFVMFLKFKMTNSDFFGWTVFSFMATIIVAVQLLILDKWGPMIRKAMSRFQDDNK